VSWDTRPCNLVENYLIFKEAFYLLLEVVETMSTRPSEKTLNFYRNEQRHVQGEIPYSCHRMYVMTLITDSGICVPSLLYFKHRDSKFRWRGCSLLALLRKSAEAVPVCRIRYEKCTNMCAYMFTSLWHCYVIVVTIDGGFRLVIGFIALLITQRETILYDSLNAFPPVTASNDGRSPSSRFLQELSPNMLTLSR
jgi:hypothetical protein